MQVTSAFLNEFDQRTENSPIAKRVRYIEIEGSNLLFLRKPVGVRDDASKKTSDWNLLYQTNRHLMLVEPPGSTTAATELLGCRIDVKTAFGENQHPIQKVKVFSPCAQSARPEFCMSDELTLYPPELE